jgi:hypothetical protein
LLRREADENAYVCLAQSDEARDPLVLAIAADPGQVRLTRALALWLLERSDAPMDADLVRSLSADDRRFLADGIRARRGRRSPASGHDRVFARFDWYQPDENWTPARLTAVDRDNIALCDRPPPVAPAEVEQGCGCSRGCVALAFAPLLRRPRRRPRAWAGAPAAKAVGPASRVRATLPA